MSRRHKYFIARRDRVRGRKLLPWTARIPIVLIRALVLGLAVLWPALVSAQDEPPKSGESEEHKRILWIIPNYRTSPTLTDYQPLTVKQKFTVAAQDARDPGTFVLAGLFAAEGQLT